MEDYVCEYERQRSRSVDETFAFRREAEGFCSVFAVPHLSIMMTMRMKERDGLRLQCLNHPKKSGLARCEPLGLYDGANVFFFTFCNRYDICRRLGGRNHDDEPSISNDGQVVHTQTMR